MLELATNDASAEEEMEREAYNAAFYELGLTWYWDGDTYRRLTSRAQGADPLRTYLETEQPHMLKAYDADFLAQAIHAVRARCHELMHSGGRCMPLHVDWSEVHRVQVGI